jgi:outer membrane receptor protein involved in Fe transport
MKSLSKRLFIIPLLFKLFVVPAFAQHKAGTIKGIVVDTISGRPLDFMTVAVKKDNTVSHSAVTAADGHFNFDRVKPGRYQLVVAAIGYTSKQVLLEMTTARPMLDLGSLLMVPLTTSLKEVSVQGSRPVIKQEADRISYDVQADMESKGLTVLDMMRKVPMLSLDADDNIKLKGNGNYKILINGKPSGMVTRNPKDVLRSMPASSVQKIEVITTPPAKYDSEGLAGIINIITNKKIDNGYNGSLNLRYQTPVGGPGGGGFITLKEGKFGITAYGGTGFNTSPKTQRLNSRVTTGENPSSLLTDGTRKFNNNYRYGGVELSYELDSLNLLNSELNPYGGYNKSTLDQYTEMSGGNTPIRYNMLTKSRYGWNGFDASLNFQHGFMGNKDRLLTFSYKYSYTANPQINDLSFGNRVNYNDPNYIQNNDGRSREQTVQLDYVHPLKKLNIEGGVKGILRNSDSNFEYRSYDDASGSYITDQGRTNKFSNRQAVIGAYNSYAYNLEQWSFKGGARIEGTLVKADFISSSSNVNTNYFNIIPTLSFNRKFKNSSSLSLGFTQRIQRPDIETLNPFVDRSIPSIESTGNPDLKAVLSNNFELTYSRSKKGSVNLGLSYHFANNTIQNVSVYNNTTGITRSTYLNIGKDKALTSNLNINYPLTEAWNLSVNGNIGYTWVEGSIEGVIQKNNGISGYGYLNTGYKFKKAWKANASFNYNAPEILLQGKSSAYTFVSFSGSKEIIKDKLTISAGINNPFSKFRYYTRSIQGTDFNQYYRSQNYNRSFILSLNWRFGQLKDAIKKNQRSIKNDDTKGGSGTSGS